jgi:nucleotide-binding universal stress UspA family protein
VLGAPRRGIGRRAPLFGTTARYVMKHSPCRVLVAATKPAARPAVAAA